jgi:hypothetical protein
VLLLSGLLSFSLLLNLRLWWAHDAARARGDEVSSSVRHAGTGRWRPESITSTLGGVVAAEDLVIVAGHAIWKGCVPEQRLDDGDWLLEEYQKGARSITAFFSHIVRG